MSEDRAVILKSDDDDDMESCKMPSVVVGNDDDYAVFGDVSFCKSLDIK